MGIPLRQSTASQEVPLGQFVDATDGYTAETGLTIANTDIRLWKNGATILADKNSGGATHIENGVYYVVLDDTDSDTVGPMVAFVTVAGARPVRVEFDVYPANVYDSLFAGTDKLQVDVAEIVATAVDSIWDEVVDGTGGNTVTGRVALAESRMVLAEDATRNTSTGAVTYKDADGNNEFTITPATTGRTRS